MIIIGKIPKKLQSFFDSMKTLASKKAWFHLWGFVLYLSLSSKPRKLIHIANGRQPKRHRTRLGAFLKNGKWQEAEILNQTALMILQSMKPQPGEFLYLIFDDTKQAKRAKLMAAIGKIFHHVLGKFVMGHTVLVGAISFRGVILPWRVRLYAKKEYCRKVKGGAPALDFQTLPDLVRQMINEFKAPLGVKVIVLFDSFYLCDKVVQACNRKGYTFISVAKTNRNFKTQSQWHKVGAYVKNLLRRSTFHLKIPAAKGWARYRTAVRDGYLSKVGPVRLVASRRQGDGRQVALITNNRTLTIREIIDHYNHRWQIEVLFKELKQYLGWTDYQMRSYPGIVRHLHLVALTHLMLTHLGLMSLGAQATKKNKVLWLPSIPVLQDQVRRLVWQDIKKEIIKGIKDEKVLRRVEQYFSGLAA
jgi:SRSO17 transposase